MSWLKSERPVTPIHIPDPRRASILNILQSPEVALSMLLIAASYYFLAGTTGSTPLQGPEGLWRAFGRKSRARMQSREAALLPDPPLVISFDMLTVVLCTFATNSLLAASSRALAKEQRRVDDEADAEWLAAVSNPKTRKDRLAKDAQELAERIRFWEANDERRKAGQTPLRDRIKKPDVMADEVMTNIIVAVLVTISLGVALSIFTQQPNVIHGVGVMAMLAVLFGGLIVCGVDRYLTSMRAYCNYVNLLCLIAMLVLLARASVLAN
ncbi:hypothetical protein JKF63_07251 [Porcisia hertigi]|uniref:Uncharacterized protein n=1 Tax=Porcisia hertigi TaxID=2761500 RepID=A0A836LLF5_9TRYP|nr:hypothetical protein JKF63_07251 [Porcisia hertigi]